VHDLEAVRGRQHGGGLRPDRGHPSRWERPVLGHDVGHRHAVDELHDLEHPVLVRAEVVQDRCAGMLEPGEDPRLAHEPLPLLLRATRQVQELDRDPPPEMGVEAVVDSAHPAAPHGEVVDLVAVGDEQRAPSYVTRVAASLPRGPDRGVTRRGRSSTRPG
jgi:hypothetical protein